MGTYRYRKDVLDALREHGVVPTEHTSPEMARAFVRELYKYQLRQLRERYLRKEFPKIEYHLRVTELRDRYPVLALFASQWVE
jgi:hypothetical protein